MYFYNLIKEMAEKRELMIFFDMDGVLAEYGIGKNPFDFLNKRPLKQNIKTIEEITQIDNVEVHVLSVCRENSQIEEKNIWLDKNAPFFKKENRNIISRESKNGMLSKDIKLEFLKNIKTDKQVVLVDDDNGVLHTIKENLDNIIVMQDSELID